jgi:hypothetical protein
VRTGWLRVGRDGEAEASCAGAANSGVAPRVGAHVSARAIEVW